MFWQNVGMWGSEGDGQAVMWAVTDMEAVPAGAMLINPQVNIIMIIPPINYSLFKIKP